MAMERIEKQPKKDLNPTIKEDLAIIGDILLKRDPEQAVDYFKRAGLSEGEIQSRLAERIDELGEESEEKIKMRKDAEKMYEQNLEKARGRGDEEAIKGYEQGLKWMKNREK